MDPRKKTLAEIRLVASDVHDFTFYHKNLASKNQQLNSLLNFSAFQQFSKQKIRMSSSTKDPLFKIYTSDL